MLVMYYVSLVVFLFSMKSILWLLRRRHLPLFLPSHETIPRPCTLLALLTPTCSRLLFPLSLWMVSLVSLRFISRLPILVSFCLFYKVWGAPTMVSSLINPHPSCCADGQCSLPIRGSALLLASRRTEALLPLQSPTQVSPSRLPCLPSFSRPPFPPSLVALAPPQWD